MKTDIVYLTKYILNLIFTKKVGMDVGLCWIENSSSADIRDVHASIDVPIPWRFAVPTELVAMARFLRRRRFRMTASTQDCCSEFVSLLKRRENGYVRTDELESFGNFSGVLKRASIFTGTTSTFGSPFSFFCNSGSGVRTYPRIGLLLGVCVVPI